MNDLQRLSIDAVRVLSMDAVQAANSGHPGTPMALAPVGYALFHKHLKHDPRDPEWVDRDRFVLSCGHASMLIYSLLHLSGYDVSEEDIKNFRQWGSPTAGHPEYGHVPGVEMTTGPLGQGVATSVGMAMAERWLAERYNRPGHEIVNHHTIALCSDGDIMEGVSHEAAALAGHQKLGKLIWIFDDNAITIDGGTDLATSTDEGARFASYGWHVTRVDDGNDLDAIDRAIDEAKSVADKPSFVVLRTTIAWGSPNKAGTSAAHGAAAGGRRGRGHQEEPRLPVARAFPRRARAPVRTGPSASREAASGAAGTAWQSRFAGVSGGSTRSSRPSSSGPWRAPLPDGLGRGRIPDLAVVDKADATRNWSGKVIQGLASGVPEPRRRLRRPRPARTRRTSRTRTACWPASPAGRNVSYGVREHAMGCDHERHGCCTAASVPLVARS